MVVRDRHRERVGQAFAYPQALYCGQRGIQRIGVVAVGIHAERAIGARRIAQGREADHIMHIRIRGHWQRAVGNGGAFGDVHGCGGQHGYVVGAVDGHGQSIAACAAAPVAYRIGEGFGQAFAHSQTLHRRQAIVQGVGIIAARIHAERTVETGSVGLWAEGHCIMNIRIHGRGQRAADACRILGNGRCGCRHGRRVVGAVNGHSQGIGGRAAVPV